ncbi:MAG: glycosyltransferase family 9 protein [Bacteroidetes bacterium]|nr:glycosyltransferase family 9 protein [Bacteroidota bacterium]
MNITPKKILIIRFSSIGDIVLCSPIVRCLKQKFPSAELCFLTKEMYKDLVIHNQNLTKVFELNEEIYETIAQLKLAQFDLVIDLHNSIRSRFICANLGIESVHYQKGNLHKFSLIYLKKSPFTSFHVVDRYFEALDELGVQNDGNGLDFYIDNDIEQKLIAQIGEIKNHFAVLVLGANYLTKMIPNNKLEEIIELISIPIVLLGGKSEMNLADELSQKYLNINNQVGKTDLLESAFWIKNAQFIVTPDTGMMHIAAAFKKKIVVVWGSTVTEFGFWPYYGKNYENKAINFFVPNLSCRPCHRMGSEMCPKGHFKCMNDQDFSNLIL